MVEPQEEAPCAGRKAALTEQEEAMMKWKRSARADFSSRERLLCISRPCTSCCDQISSRWKHPRQKSVAGSKLGIPLLQTYFPIGAPESRLSITRGSLGCTGQQLPQDKKGSIPKASAVSADRDSEQPLL